MGCIGVQGGLFVGARRMFACQQGVHGGNHKNGEQAAKCHATHNHPANLAPALSPGASSHGQGHRPQHHGAGGHHDGSQALNS